LTIRVHYSYNTMHCVYITASGVVNNEEPN
jgi:hypothetical protein